MKKGTHIIKDAVELFDTRNYSFSFWEEHCKEEGIEYNEDKIDWDYISDCLSQWQNAFREYCVSHADFHAEISMDWDYIKEVLSEVYDGMEIIISGELGLWNGSPRIHNVLCDNIEDALSRCLNKMDDFIVSYDNWGIYVKAMHHDGTNSFILSPIKKGTYINEEVLYRFTPNKYKRLIHRINTIWHP